MNDPCAKEINDQCSWCGAGGKYVWVAIVALPSLQLYYHPEHIRGHELANLACDQTTIHILDAQARGLNQKLIRDMQLRRSRPTWGVFSHRLLQSSPLCGNLPALPLMQRSRPKNFDVGDTKGFYTRSLSGGVCGGRALPGSAEYTIFCFGQLFQPQ